MTRLPTLVTNDLHSVSCYSGTGIDGVILRVRRIAYTGDRYILQRASHDGMRFATGDDARRFAWERGYLRPYYVPRELRADRVARGAETYERIRAWREANA